MKEEIMSFLGNHGFFILLIYAIIMDSLLGLLRAMKEKKVNSAVGIDGSIRKVAMLFSVLFLMLVDSIVEINFLFMIPSKYMEYIGLNRIGICEIFCILYTLYETVSILKNMTLCGLPVPDKLRKFITKFLEDMTEELPEEILEELQDDLDALELDSDTEVATDLDSDEVKG